MKDVKFSKVSLAVLMLLFASCSRPADSRLDEAADNRNRIDGDDLKYSEISGRRTYKTADYPWTDTYWPRTEKSMARRWGAVRGSADAEIIGGAFGVAELLSSYVKTLGASQLPLNLSPAEKYDAIFRFRHGRTVDTAGILEKIKGIDELEKAIDGTEDLKVKSQKSYEIYKLLENSQAPGALESTMPLLKSSLSSFAIANSDPSRKFLNTLGSGTDWSWEGLCHGWAPAALMEKTPKNHVLATFGDQKILVTEGDLRGLLTQSWADHVTTDYFVGARCEQDLDKEDSPGPVDPSGRGYSGSMEIDGVKTYFYTVRDYQVSDSRKPLGQSSVYLVELADSTGSTVVLSKWWVKGQNRPYVAVWERYDSVHSLMNAIRSKKNDGKFVAVDEIGCWDVNPASLHQIVVSKLGKDQTGFVMDRTQSGQVWNQPVHSAVANVGDLVSINELSFSRLKHLTPGTVMVAPVKLTLNWLGEPGKPQFEYEDDFDIKHNAKSVYRYFLEIDRLGNVIGGEWGDLNSPRPANQIIPDFLFGHNKGTKPKDDLAAGFDYSGIIGKLHECSLLEVDTQVDAEGKTFPAVSCPIERVSGVN